jgi:hypothetical protein
VNCRVYVGRALRAGAAVFALFVAAVLPAAEASTMVQIPDGSLLEVWQAGEPNSGGVEIPEEYGIAYSLLDASGTHIGIVSPPGENTQDSSPVLALEPAGQVPVVAWSRSDGVSLKIAYARFEADEWRDFHFLTFGTADDIEPRIGTSSGGSYLFYITQDNHYMYAPVDLTAGNLFAAPREIKPRYRIDTLGTEGSAPEGLNDEGGTDIPTILGLCDPAGPEPCSTNSGGGSSALQSPHLLEGANATSAMRTRSPHSTRTGRLPGGRGGAMRTRPPHSARAGRLPGGHGSAMRTRSPHSTRLGSPTGLSDTGVPGFPLTSDGGTDVPVVVGASTSVWWVASSLACSTQVLVRPNATFLNIEVIGFTNGQVELLDQSEMPWLIPGDYASTIASTYLQSICN